jgi:hypothetical protein
MPPDSFDFQTIVSTAARMVERQRDVSISPSAIEVLVSRAVEHSDAVAAEFAERGLTNDDLIEAARRQLLESLPPEPPQQQQQQQQQRQQQQQPEMQQQQQQQRQQQTVIDADSVRHGMRSKCWFVPWC